MTAQGKIESSLASAMAAAFAEIEGATKSAKNPHFKSKYADITAVIDAIKPALITHGLFFTQHPEPSDRGITVETWLHHAGGESLSLGKLYVPANKQDAQGFGSALTYARRYALVTAFGVPTEDDDGNAAVASQGKRQEGQSQNGAVNPPAKQPAHSALKTQIRTFVHEMEGCGDMGEWLGLKEASKDLLNAVREKLPQWWEGGSDMPEEFVPLHRRIEILEANLQQNEPNILAAG